MTVNHYAAQLTLRTRVLTLATLPAARAWENERFTPTAGQPYVAEEYVPGGSSLIGLTPGGTVNTEGLYIIRWCGLAGPGLSVAAGADALVALFPPGLALTSTDGATTVRIRGNPAPWRGQIQPRDDGWAVVLVTVPFRIYSTNPLS